MKYTLRSFAFLMLLYFLPNLQVAAQDQIPTINFTQGKIIGDLPYGQHFFILGSTKLPDGTTADKVQVSIWRTGRKVTRKAMKTLAALDTSQISAIRKDPSKLVNTSEWRAYRAEDKNNFKAYINSSLRFQTEYLVEISYSRVFDIQLTAEEKDEVIQAVLDGAFDIFDRNGIVSEDEIHALLDLKTSQVIYKKLNRQNETFFNRDQIKDNLPVVLEHSLTDLAEIIPPVAINKQINEDREKQIKELQAKIPDASAEEKADLQSQIKNLKDQIKRDAVALEQETQLTEKLAVIRKQLLVVGKEYTVSAPNATSVPSLDAVRVGTTFGGGAVGLNVPSDRRDFDSFGYSALKYYFMPVDKRIAEPYLGSAFLINRMSLMVGFSTKSEFDYHGSTLDQALAITPVLGLSVDVNRFFTIDLGMTTFKQSSLSPLSSDEELRVGPVLGVNLEADMFNRVSSLASGEKYKIKAAPNQ